MNSALAHGNHSGVTVAYDDANNRFIFTAASGGAGAPVYRKVNVTANAVTGAVMIVGHGTQAELNAATVTVSADGSSVTVAGLASTFKLTSVSANTPANFNSGTAFTINCPDPYGLSNIDDHPLATLLHFNSANAAVLQGQTQTSVAVVAGVLTLSKSGLVGGTAARWKATIQ